MRYLDIKLIETKLREDTSEYTVVVIYIDGEKYQITNILKKHMDSPRFAAAIQKMAKRKFPGKQFKTFYVVGADGGKIDGYDFNVLKTDELDPDGVPDKKDDKKDDNKGEIDPQDADSIELDTTPLPKPPKVQPETNNDAIKLPSADQVDPADEITDNEIAAITKKQQKDQPTFTFLDNNATAAMDYNTKRSKTVDKDRDGKNDETGEVLPLIYDDGTLRDPNNPEKVIGTVPGYKKPIERDLEGGSTGSGEEGESGLSGEQAETAPDIADEIYEAIDGLGTSEGRLLKALERIETRPHLFEIIKQYKDKYKSTMSTDIIADFKYDLGKSQFLIDEINDVMGKLGYVLYGSKFFTLTWVDTSEIKINGNYVGYQPKIGWHKGVVISIKGQSFGISPFKKDGWFGTSVGAKYAIGRVEPRDNPNAPQSPGILAGQISRFTTIEKLVGFKSMTGKWVENLVDNYIEDNINDNGIMPPVKAGDTVDNDVYRMLTFLGEKGNEMLWSMYNEETKEYSKLSQEAADAINNYKGKTE